MKKVIAIGMLVAGIAVFGGSSYKDWFTPSSGWGKQTVPINIQFSTVNWKGNMPVTATLNDALKLLDSVITEDVPQSAQNAFKLSKAALANSIFAACQAQMNKVKIDNLGAALEGMFVASYGQYQDKDGNVISKTKSGIDTSKLRQQLIANKNAVVSGGQASGGSESNPLKLIITQKPYDKRQFEQHVENGNSLTSLKGWYNLVNTGTAIPYDITWAFSLKDFYLPITSGKDDELKWGRWNGLDASCFSAGDDGGTGSQNNGPVHLRHWNGGDGGCGENLQNLLTNKNESIAADRRKHYFLTRYGENNAQTHELHWVSMAESAMEVGGGEPNVDDHSIVLAKDEDASSEDAPKKLRLKGFDAAKSARTKDGKVPTIPNLKPTGEDIEWTSFKDFFADSVFKTSDTTGKVLLNGTKEGDKKLQVLAVQYGDTSDDQTLSSFSGDGVSIDFGFTSAGQTVESPLAQLHNFSTAPSPYGGYSTLNFADALTNDSANINGMSIPVRYPNGNKVEIGYIPMGKVTGIPSASVDNLTIEATKDADAGDNDPEKLRIVGAKTATKGQLLKMGDNGKVEWGYFPIDVDRPEGSVEDGYPLYIAAADPQQDEPAKIGIRGWETTDSPEGLYGAGNGKPVTYRFADIQSLEADGDLRTIELTGYGDAGNYSMAYKDSENGLGWVAPPSSGSALLTMNHGAEPTATVLGNSVETETINNKVTLNIKGFTNGGGCDTTMSSMMTEDSQASNRDHHQVLTRYSTGSGTPALHWVPMGDKVSGGGGADVDGVSITTNTANGAVTSGLASIYGFSTASAGDVPHKKSDGTIEWKKASGGTSGSFSLTVNKVSDTNYTFSIQAGYVCRARKYNFVSGTTVSGTGYVWLKSTMGSSASVIEMGTSSFVQSTDEYTYTPLYFVNGANGKFTDYRFAPHIQEWE